MTTSAEERFYKDVSWMLDELKQEELANTYSKYQIKFFFHETADGIPSIRSQRRVLKMLSDRGALALTPFYHRLSLLDSALEMQGADPIGFYINILQPRFNEIYEEVVQQKAPLPSTKHEWNNPPAQVEEKYYISHSGKPLLINNTFILTTPRFESENDKFIDSMLEHPDETFDRDAIKKIIPELGKSFSAILNDLGFRGEIRKAFFKTSKVSVRFSNNLTRADLENRGVDMQKLAHELSGLERFGEKRVDTDTDE